jgi:hypothetical protein
MAARIPSEKSRWVFDGNQWLPAKLSIKPPTVVPYTLATVFVNNGRVIDGLNDGLSHEDVDALKAKYPDDVVQLGNEFELPLVPVGTVIDITPEAVTARPAKKRPNRAVGKKGGK